MFVGKNIEKILKSVLSNLQIKKKAIVPKPFCIIYNFRVFNLNFV